MNSLLLIAFDVAQVFRLVHVCYLLLSSAFSTLDLSCHTKLFNSTFSVDMAHESHLSCSLLFLLVTFPYLPFPAPLDLISFLSKDIFKILPQEPNFNYLQSLPRAVGDCPAFTTV